MKLKQALLPLAALSLAASLATPLAALADDDAAYSANVVGVLRYTIPANGVLTCITLPLNPVSSGTNDNTTWNWSDTSLAQQLDRGTIAYFWTGTGWAQTTKQRNSWSSEKEVVPGQAIFLQGPETATEDKTITLLGELPMDTQYLPLAGNGSLNMSGVTAFPQSMLLSESPLADLPRNTIIYRWNGSQWKQSTKQRNDWSTDFEFGIGEGAFVELNGDSQNIEEPFPFNLEN